MSLLSVKGLGKSFGGVRAVDGIDFDIAPGELLCLEKNYDCPRECPSRPEDFGYCGRHW